jgi:hypothetical protein
MLALPTSTRLKVGDASGNIVAKSLVKYDESSFPLLTEGSTTGWIDPGTSVRGNPTTTGQWLTGSTYLQSHEQYDQFGNLRKSWGARDTSLSNPSQIQYSIGDGSAKRRRFYQSMPAGTPYEFRRGKPNVSYRKNDHDGRSRARE